MLMIRMISLSAAVLAAGCASTVSDRAADAPKATYVSDRTVDALRDCLVERVNSFGNPNVLPRADGIWISYGGDSESIVLIALKPLSQGTSVEVRQKNFYLSRGAVESCIKG